MTCNDRHANQITSPSYALEIEVTIADKPVSSRSLIRTPQLQSDKHLKLGHFDWTKGSQIIKPTIVLQKKNSHFRDAGRCLN